MTFFRPRNDKSTTHWLLLSTGLPLVFLLLCLLLNYLYSCLSDEFLLHHFHAPFVDLCVTAINVLFPGESVTATGNILISNKATMALVRTCDGADAFFIIAAAILAYPTVLPNKLRGLVNALIVVMLLNYVRIIILFYLLAYQKSWFVPVHQNIAPIVVLSVSCAFFVLWMQSIRKISE